MDEINAEGTKGNILADVDVNVNVSPARPSTSQCAVFAPGFSTGYANFEYLKMLPSGFLKIQRTIVGAVISGAYHTGRLFA